MKEMRALRESGQVVTILLTAGVLQLSCARSVDPPEPAAPSAQEGNLGRMGRSDFNKLAAELALPLFWRVDTNSDGRMDPDEVELIWGLDST